MKTTASKLPLFSTAKWIGATLGADDGLDQSNGKTGAKGAPWLRQEFTLKSLPAKAFVHISAPGWYELHINGKRVGDEVLAPVVMQLTAHTPYQILDVAPYLKRGRNAVAVLLGNGWFNCQTRGPWQLDEAPWRTAPPMALELVTADTKGGETLALVSNVTWKAALSPITMNSLRNGERQDLRLDQGDPSVPGFDDSQWVNAKPINAPMGTLKQQDCPPCRIFDRIEPVSRDYIDGGVDIYDFGRNITGWCEIEAEGPAGSQVILYYSERRQPYGTLDRKVIDFTSDGVFQTDRYTLDGKGMRLLHPHFTYYGFRHVQVVLQGGATLKSIRACFIHTDLKPAGKFTTSDKALTWLQDTNAYTYLCNHTGIPTDCPHREKNGWTGDAALALETGLWNFDVAASAAHFGDMLMDAQRPNGQLPCITPTGGWGFNWGSGPAWDTCIFETAWQLWQFTGETALIERRYDGMARYVDYLRWQERDSDGVVYYGLGDWCPYDRLRMCPPELTSTGYYFEMVNRLAAFAQLLGKKDDIKKWRELAAHIQAGFAAKFMSKGDGSCGNGSLTALAAALYFGLAPKNQADKTRKLLLKQLKANGCKADFGILGAKYVAHVLGDMGAIDELLTLFTQEECPGWGYWRKAGATTFWETWQGRESQTHIMFGDPSACLFRYVAGIIPAAPGFTKITLKPAVTSKLLPDFRCTYQAPQGEILSELVCKKGGKRTYRCHLPKGTEATLWLPGRDSVLLAGGKDYSFDL